LTPADLEHARVLAAALARHHLRLDELAVETWACRQAVGDARGDEVLRIATKIDGVIEAAQPIYAELAAIEDTYGLPRGALLRTMNAVALPSDE
jgi:hypothetical protein